MQKNQETRAATSRRSFLAKTAAAGTLLTILPRHVLGGPRFVPPSETVNVALIGAGGQGRTNLRSLFNEADCRVVAVCDPNEYADYEPFYYKGVAGRRPIKKEIEDKYSQAKPGFRCAEYEDFRTMFEKEKGIDAVLCATPDHLHALISITAMKLGKHIYCEKPLTHSVWEARQVANVAKETGVATQMGNQGHSGDAIRSTCEWIWDGAIGKVHEVHAWTRAKKWFSHVGRPTESATVPSGLNWDLWLGPRKTRPFHPSYAPVRWRSYWDFGTASLGDMACHNIDPAVWALDLRAPISVEASASETDAETTPFGGVYRYKFAARGDMPPVKLTWYDGGVLPERPAELADDDEMGAAGNGILFYGDKGVMMCAGWGGTPRLLPDAKMDAYTRPKKTLTRSKGHHRDWLDACKGGPAASSSFEYGARLTELVLLGNVALRAGKKILWDGDAMKVTNMPEANQYLKGDYRKGWELPA